MYPKLDIYVFIDIHGFCFILLVFLIYYWHVFIFKYTHYTFLQISFFVFLVIVLSVLFQPPRYYWIIVESGVKHHTKTLFFQFTASDCPFVIFIFFLDIFHQHANVTNIEPFLPINDLLVLISVIREIPVYINYMEYANFVCITMCFSRVLSSYTDTKIYFFC